MSFIISEFLCTFAEKKNLIDKLSRGYKQKL